MNEQAQQNTLLRRRQVLRTDPAKRALVGLTSPGEAD